MEYLVLALIEGFTEYLPISSTGHMILASAAMGIQDNEFTKNFTVIVQFGAILAVLVLYRERFLRGLALYKKLTVAFIPVAVLGMLVKNSIDLLLGDVQVVAYSLLIGGVVLLFVDRIFPPSATHSGSSSIEGLTYQQAFVIGVFQCIAFIPGVSRAAATMIGGLSQKLSRRHAAEFSFYLAVPTLTAATGVKLLKIMKTIEPEQVSVLLWGNLISFVVGWITIKVFIGMLSQGGLKIFGIYRIIVGSVILFLIHSGHSLSKI